MLLGTLGSANIRIGLASQDTPLNIAHCIARHTTQVPRRNVQDQVSYTFLTSVLFIALYGLVIIIVFGFQLLNSQVSTTQYMEREKAYDTVSLCTLLPLMR